MDNTAPKALLLHSYHSDDWRVLLVRGALAYHGIKFSETDRIDRESVIVVCTESEAQYRQLVPDNRANDIVVVPGLSWSWALQSSLAAPIAGTATVLGEPYAFLAEYLTSPEVRTRSRGQVVIGYLGMPKFRVDLSSSETTAVVTSLGCCKACGYCGQGELARRLYGDVRRRERPWREISDDLDECCRQGRTTIRLIAQHFLDIDFDQNAQLRELAARWRRVPTRPTVGFTVCPDEINPNHRLLEDLAAAFRIRPRLSIDSFCPETRRLFGLSWGDEQIHEAICWLTSHRISFRVNYILIRPGMSDEMLATEFKAMQGLVDLTGYFDIGDRLKLALDLFTNCFRPQPGTPLVRKQAKIANYQETLPPRVFELHQAINTVLCDCIDRIRRGEPVDPARKALEAAQSVIGNRKIIARRG